MEISIDDFPLPPSANDLNINRSGGGRGRYNSTKYLSFKSDVRSWWLHNNQYVHIYRKRVKEWVDNGWYLRVDCVFRFKSQRLWTQEGKPKALDSSNYLKACHDELAKVLDVDDKFFWNGTFDKLPARGGKECTEITINRYFPEKEDLNDPSEEDSSVCPLKKERRSRSATQLLWYQE